MQFSCWDAGWTKARSCRKQRRRCALSREGAAGASTRKGLVATKYARVPLKAETRAIGRSRACSELQRNINYIRVHGFVLRGAPVPNKTGHSGRSCAAARYHSRSDLVDDGANVGPPEERFGEPARSGCHVTPSPPVIRARAKPVLALASVCERRSCRRRCRGAHCDPQEPEYHRRASGG